MNYLKATFQVFMNYRPLLFNLVSRDFKVKYRRSVLGMLWSVLNPLMMMLVMWLVFGTLFERMGLGGGTVVASTGLPPKFVVYLITGQVCFNFYSESTSAAMDSVLGNAQLIKKVYIPKYIFPLEKVLFGFINMLFSLVTMLFVIVITGSPVSWWVLLAPVVLALLFVFNLGVGLILSCLVVFFRDIKHLYGIFTLALTYLTPIFYSEDMIFKPYSLPSYIVKCNPMYWYVGMFRQVMVYGRAPDVRMWFATIGCAALALVLGLVIFRKKQDDFILYI